MAYSPATEALRSKIASVFPSADVDKMLWVIEHESRGNPNSVGDGGAAHGLFQSHYVGENATVDQQIADAYRLYSANKAKGLTGFEDWGEGTNGTGPFNSTTGRGQFGSLGDHPYGGGATGATVARQDDGKGNYTVDDGKTWYRASDNARWIPPSAGGDPNGTFVKSAGPIASTGGASGAGSIQEITLPSGRKQLYDTATGQPIGASYDPKSSTEVSGDTRATLGYYKDRDLAQQGIDAAKQKAQQANDDRDYAIKIGDFKLAQQKADDANYWSGIQNQLEQSSQGLTARGQDISAANSAANTAQMKYDSDQAFQTGMANAQNGAEQNQITARWNAEQAAIRKMEDQTTRDNAQMTQQGVQFNNETQRAVQEGQLTLNEQKQIMDEASQPRNLFNLYMTQRGARPDWDTLTAGGVPGSMTPMAPGSALKTYTPTTAAFDFTKPYVNSQAAAVGQATTYRPGDNKFIGASTAKAPAVAPAPATWAPKPTVFNPPSAGAPRIDPTAIPQSPVAPNATPPPAAADPYHSGGNTWSADGTAGGRWTDPSGHYQSNGGSWVNPDGSAYGAGGAIEGAIGFGAKPPTEAGRYAGGGPTTSDLIMAGDANNPNPEAGGAEPELISNPTHAPLEITPNPDNRTDDVGDSGSDGIRSIISRMLDLLAGSDTPSPDTSGSGSILSRMAGPPRYALGTDVGPYNPDTDPTNAYGSAGATPYRAEMPEPQAAPDAARADSAGMAPVSMAQGVKAAPWSPTNGGIISGAISPLLNQPPFVTQAQPATPVTAPVSVANNGSPSMNPINITPAPVSAPGTMVNQTAPATAPGVPGVPGSVDTSGAYAAAGMGGQYIPTSANPGITPEILAGLPERLAVLVRAGVPIPPALLASATGQLPGKLNVAQEVTNRQLGALPSKQALDAMTPGERELIGNGYYGSVGGLPWGDVADFIARGTKKLKTAARSRGV